MSTPGSVPSTLQDVARLAGVSAKTVARALNGEEHVRPETRERVARAADVLHFRPNRLARELRQGGRTASAGLVVGTLDDPFCSQVAAGVERALREEDLSLVIASTDHDPQREQVVVQAMLERRVRALLVVPAAEDHAYLEGERQAGTPLVFLDRPPVALLADSVLWDNRSGVLEAVGGLVAAGHRDIAALAGRRSHVTARERLAAFSDAVQEHGLDPGRCLVVSELHDATDAHETVRALLSRPVAPTALLALESRIGVGAAAALLAAGSDAALVGFGEFELAEALGVTVVATDPREMGYQGGRLALTRMRGPGAHAERLVLPTRLVRRGSGERPPPRAAPRSAPQASPARDRST